MNIKREHINHIFIDWMNPADTKMYSLNTDSGLYPFLYGIWTVTFILLFLAVVFNSPIDFFIKSLSFAIVYSIAMRTIDVVLHLRGYK